MATNQAKDVTEISVKDPDTGNDVNLCVFKDMKSGGMFAIDASFIDQESDVVPNPFCAGEIIHCPAGETDQMVDPKEHDMSCLMRILESLYQVATELQKQKAINRSGLKRFDFHRFCMRATGIVNELYSGEKENTNDG